jgi:hypothetical protein
MFFSKIKNNLFNNTDEKFTPNLNKSEELKIIKNSQSTQKKNIFYFSFKNIRERYQFKEQRANRIQIRNEKIIKDLLPPINSGSKMNTQKKI